MRRVDATATAGTRRRRRRYDAAASQHRIATVAATTTLSWHSVGATTIISRPSKTTYLQASLIRYNPEKGDHFFDDLLRTSSSHRYVEN